jgi:hypothetical protein
MGEPVVAPDFLRIQIEGRIPVSDFGANLAAITGRIKKRDPTEVTTPSPEITTRRWGEESMAVGWVGFQAKKRRPPEFSEKTPAGRPS